MVRTLLVCLIALVPLRPGVIAQDARLDIDVVAVDRRGNPVTDLKQEEIEVWIGGRRIPIESFALVTPAAGARPERSITLIVDNVTLTPVGLARAKEIARNFVSRISAGDQITVIGLNGDAARSTDDPTVATRRIEQITLAASTFMRAEDLSEHVLTTLASLSRQVAESEARRRVIVAIGAGWLFDTPIPPATQTARTLRTEWSDAVRAMAGANAVLYVIDPGGVGMTAQPGGRHGFARDMGGHAFVNTNDHKGAVNQILRDAGTYYAVTVADPPIFKNADVRDLDVRVLRRGVEIRARRFLRGRP